MEDRRPSVLIVGSPAHTDYALRALSHPDIEVQAADKENRILAALTGQKFDLAVVGGSVGKRGPLVLCEAVRLRQELPVLVLVGDETDDGALREHQNRQLAGVRYLDFRGQWNGETPPIDVGQLLRSEALGALNVAEDPTAAVRWVEELETARSLASPANGVPVAAPVTVETATGTSDAPTARTEELNEDDVDFAARVVERTRGVDFRTEEATPGTADVDAAEVKTLKLRHRVRTLERQLARLAFVYAQRQENFDSADATIHQLESHIELLETQHHELAQQGAHGDQRAARLQRERDEYHTQWQLTHKELQQARHDAEAERRARAEQEQNFASMLNKAQSTFGELRDHSAQALKHNEEQLAQKQRELDMAYHHRAELEHEMHSLRESTQQKTEESAALLQKLVDEQQRFEAIRQDLDQRLHANHAELLTLQSRLEQQSQLETTLRRDLDGARLELAHAVSERSQERDALEQDFATARTSLLEKIDKLKESAATFRDAYHEREQQLNDAAQERAVLETKVEEQQKSFAQLETMAAKAGDEEARAALETHLQALEKLGAESRQHIDQQLSMLDDMGRRIQKQGEVLARLADSVVRNAPEQVNTWQDWLYGNPYRLVAAGSTALALLLAISTLALALGGDDSPAATAATLVAPTPVSASATPPAAAPATDPQEPDADNTRKAVVAEAANVSPNDATAEPQPAAPTETTDVFADEDPPTEAPTLADSAPAPTANPVVAAPPVGTEDDRKALRQKMFGALGKRKWALAAELGLALQAGYHLDWEAHFRLAEALRRAQRTNEAIETYQSFAQSFPDNAFADDALFVLGSLLVKQGRKSEAAPYFERLVRINGPLSKKAKAMLLKTR